MKDKKKPIVGNGTVNQFLETCWDLMQRARREGATIRDLYELLIEAKGPPCTFSSFSTAYHAFAKSRRVLVEQA